MKRLFKYLLSLLVIFLPNIFKIPIYRKVYKYKIGKGVKIGFSWIYVDKLEISDRVIIGHLNRFKNIPYVRIGTLTTIGNGNTFTSTDEFTNIRSLQERGNTPQLIIGSNCGIVMFHYFDIQDHFEIGDFTTISGKNSSFYSHYLDIVNGKQSAKPIRIGKYCMLGSGVQFAPGAKVPDYCVVGIGSVVSKEFTESFYMIAGNPAVEIKMIPENAAYFHRTRGWIGSYTDPPN